MRPVSHRIANAATVTTSGTGTQLNNPRQTLSGVLGGVTAAILVFVTGAVTGTSPSLVYNLEVSNDGVNWIVVASTTAITATNGKQRAVAQNIVEPYIRVSPAVTGTTPSLAGVTVDLVLG